MPTCFTKTLGSPERPLHSHIGQDCAVPSHGSQLNLHAEEINSKQLSSPFPCASLVLSGQARWQFGEWVTQSGAWVSPGARGFGALTRTIQSKRGFNNCKQHLGPRAYPTRSARSSADDRVRCVPSPKNKVSLSSLSQHHEGKLVGKDTPGTGAEGLPPCSSVQTPT